MALSEDRFIRYRRFVFLSALAASAVGTTGCLHRRGAEMVAFTGPRGLMVRGDCHTRSKGCVPLKPVEADIYASEQYDMYKESGFITLKPNMQLRIVAPIRKDGSSDAPISTASSTGQSGTITEHAPKNLIGYETAVYTVVGRRGSVEGSVSLRLDGISIQPIGKHSEAGMVQTDYLATVNKPRFLRLYFQLRHAPANHAQVLLVGDSQGELNEASGEFEQDPDAYCAAEHPHARCVVFPPQVAVNAEILVYVHKKPVHVPLAATVSDALIAAGVKDPKSVVDDLTIERVWDSHTVDVNFKREGAAILSLPLTGGDRIGF
ncbi:MAG TPA: hypothetical protein VN633_16445 [Bryobacteraceae bacterium]|nr:hypothetical protein [Bryobacteraceae bacterium]